MPLDMTNINIDPSGWARSARQIHSPNFDNRSDPSRSVVSLLVIHYISLPAQRFTGDAIERLFTNQLRADDPNPDLAGVAALKVSAHFVIRRHGQLEQFVSCDHRAWHAGVSMFAGRERCNDFSIGIEMEGSSLRPFTQSQYRVLLNLIQALRNCYGIQALAGHCDIAPGRKEDPGPLFDWDLVLDKSGLPRPQCV
jgi:N-acetyl-anhydromuramoyl-L-alanine amidase